MILFLCSFFILFYLLPKVFIDIKQLYFIKEKLNQKATILNQEDYQKAGIYTISTLKYSIFSSLFECLIFIFWLIWGIQVLQTLIFDKINSPFLHSLCFFVGFIFIHTLLQLPLEFYKEMVLDKKFGFTKASIGLFIQDRFKGLVLILVFSTIIISGLILIIQSVPFWWFWGFLLLFVISLIINILYPTVFAPLFNKFTPLEDRNLKEKIDSLLNRVGFESSGIFVMDASRRDGRLNAYFGGLGRTKRVILFDTLLKNISTDGLLAILGHELGHFKHGDIKRNLILQGGIIFIIFLLANYGIECILKPLQLEINGGEICMILVLLMPIISFWITPILGFFSRKAEYKADLFGSSLTSKAILANALVRIVNENKSFPYSHPLYVAFHYTHPPLLDRLRALEYQF